MAYKITKRELTVQDFLQLKNFSFYKKLRFQGKTVGLATLFACQGPTLGAQLKEAGITEHDINLMLDNFNLSHTYNTALNNPLNKVEPLTLKYNIVGTKLRDLFFQTYPGLLKRVEREQAFAIKHGYVRTWSGPVRHLPDLRYFNYSANKKSLLGYDKSNFSKMFSGMKNEASNSTIQTAEVQQAMPDTTCIHRNLKDWGFKSRIWNYVHDSLNLYVYKPEKDVVYALLNKVANLHREPYFGIGMQIDAEECDFDLNEYYGNGREFNIKHYDLDKELKNWNINNNTNLTFTNYIPETINEMYK